ncbi:protein lurp-one-related 7 [Quercus suber]|uniref:Protein lurp-one-related 7 n=1 Tax=Quercus suber TaxID=58331 RepID=A0AAW0M4W4_QUESU
MASSPIPVDLFVSKKHPGLIGGDLGFANASGNVTFRVNRQSSPKNKRLFLGSTGNPLISIYRYRNGSWQGFTGEDDQKQCIFRVQRTVNKLTRTELEVFLVGENGEDSASTLKVKGCPFQKSCTIYRGNDVVAQVQIIDKCC